MTQPDFRKWLAIGTGVGMEIAREDLLVTVVRVLILPQRCCCRATK